MIILPKIHHLFSIIPIQLILTWFKSLDSIIALQFWKTPIGSNQQAYKKQKIFYPCLSLAIVTSSCCCRRPVIYSFIFIYCVHFTTQISLSLRVSDGSPVWEDGNELQCDQLLPKGLWATHTPVKIKITNLNTRWKKHFLPFWIEPV